MNTDTTTFGSGERPAARDPRCPTRAQRGAVIVVVLALIMLASFLLSRFIERALTEMVVETRAHQTERLRADAFSALETTLAVLADYQTVDQGLYSPAQGWGDPLASGDYEPRAGASVDVAFEDETGKISLPHMDQAAMESLGVELGLKEVDAKRLADALLGWTTANHASAEFATDPRNYEYEDPPHHPPGRALESWDELASVVVARDLFYQPDGTPSPLRQELAQRVSLFDFAASNINSAGVDRLQLAGLDEGEARRVLEYNSGKTPRSAAYPGYFKNVSEAQAAAGATSALSGFDTLVRVLRIRVTAHEGATAFHLDVVVTPTTSQQAAARENAVTDTSVSNNPTTGSQASGTSSGPLQYPFTVLSLEESVEMQSAPPTT